jgi:hypothetical protein
VPPSSSGSSSAVSQTARERFNSAVEPTPSFAPRAERRSLLRRPALAVPLAAALVALVALAAWLAWGARERSRARARLGELEQLVERHELVKAWLLVEELRPILGDDRELERQRLAISLPHTVRTEPPGAEISFRGYLDDPSVWHPLGTSPVERLLLPATALVSRPEAGVRRGARGAATRSARRGNDAPPSRSSPQVRPRKDGPHLRGRGYGGARSISAPFWLDVTK